MLCMKHTLNLDTLGCVPRKAAGTEKDLDTSSHKELPLYSLEKTQVWGGC